MKRFLLIITLFLLGTTFVARADDTIYTSPLLLSKKDGAFIFTGTIDKTKHSNFKDFEIHGEVFAEKPDSSGGTAFLAYPGVIKDDASYTFTIDSTHVSQLTPGKRYFLRQTVKDPSNGVQASQIYPFVSDGVIIPEGSVAEQNYYDSKSYNLLAPWPGLSRLLDPDVCIQERLKTNNPNLVCDINSFLNFAFKTLIGLAAVALVLRLIYEGYQYLVTDVPFLKASAKSGFFSALGGLFLALSAWIILNTINPKLVSNSITIDQVSVGVEKTRLSEAVFTNITGRPIKAKPELLAILKTVATQKNIDACIPQAIIQQENATWDETLVGCDENVAREGIPSRKAFIQSGITLMGKTVSTDGLLNNKVRNDSYTGSSCDFDASKPGYNLDWRFSKGFGLSQKTIFPAGYKESSWYNDVKQGGPLWNARSTIPTNAIRSFLSDPKVQITYLIDHYRENAASCLGDLEKSFRAYNGGNCNTINSSAVTYGKQVKANYDLCKQNDG